MIENHPIKFELNASDKNSVTWQKLREHFEKSIVALREKNDSIGNDERETLKIRTEIALYKSLLKL